MADYGHALECLRARRPLVQQITNYVAMDIAANAMLAIGASPAMVHAEDEASEFAGLADALTINIGTLSRPWTRAMCAAATAASEAGKPWVLDPVAVGATGFRREAASDLMAIEPAVVRGNASEIRALAGEATTGQGADSTDAVDAAEAAARRLAGSNGAVVAVTGETDFVVAGDRCWRVANGSALMPRVTALGCALTGIIAAFVASGEDAGESVVAGLACYGVAGEIAERDARGPGSFRVAFIDALAGIDADTIRTHANVESA